jgi:aldehyde dehydrogenase (NAD+)
LLAKLVPEYFAPEFLTVVTGAIPLATALLEQKYDHIVYTGGSHGAKFVAAAAAKNLTPYTLELGGKNPCVVDVSAPDAKLELYARRIMWGKFSNGGQFCIGSDHVIVVGSEEREEKFLAYAKKAANEFSKTGQMTRVVNAGHFGRLEGLFKNTGGQLVHGGDFDRENLKIGITIVKNVDKNDSLMGDEIFGPLLPVVRVDTIDQAVDSIRGREIPLAL